MSVTRVCPTCGFAGTYATDATAAHHHGQHSCTRHLRLAAIAQERAARADRGPTRGCVHASALHVHGTRAAYVKDRCRCVRCTAANTAASRRAQRQRMYGRWAPFVPAAPARAHVAELRAAGLGLRRIAHLAEISPTTLRAVTATGADGRPVRIKIRPATAAAILAVDTAEASRAARSTIDSTGTRRRLQALVAIGWDLREIAARLQRTPTHVTRTMNGGRVTVRTAEAVGVLYDQLWDVRPAQDNRRAREALASAARNGWRPPLAWDDIDTDASPQDSAGDDPGGYDIDEIAVERALAGDGVRLAQLTPAEQEEVVRRMTQRGQSIGEIADRLGTTARTVSRRRRSVADAA